MTNDEIRIKIAGTLGWNTEKEALGGVYIYRDPKGNMQATLPDYCNDLNAMYQAEEWLLKQNNILWHEYSKQLKEIAWNKHSLGGTVADYAHINALSRASSFCKVIEP